jgi:hypothetical protein
MTATNFKPGADTTPKQKNPVGSAAMWVGVAAFVSAFLPVLSFVAWFPGMVAMGLGIAGLVLANRRQVGAVFGVVLGTLSIAIGVISSVGWIAVLAHFIEGASA